MQVSKQNISSPTISGFLQDMESFLPCFLYVNACLLFCRWILCYLQKMLLANSKRELPQLRLMVTCATLSSNVSNSHPQASLTRIYPDTNREKIWFNCLKMPKTTALHMKSYTQHFMRATIPNNVSRLTEFYKKFGTLPILDEKTIISLFRFYLGLDN